MSSTLIYNSNAILMKIPAGFLLELENLILKCKWSNKSWRIKPLLKNKLRELALLEVVLVCLGFSDKLPQTGELLNNRKRFLTILELEWETRMQNWGKAFLPAVCQTFCKNTYLFVRALLPWPAHLPKAHLLTPSPLGVRIWILERQTF